MSMKFPPGRRGKFSEGGEIRIMEGRFAGSLRCRLDAQLSSPSNCLQCPVKSPSAQ